MPLYAFSCFKIPDQVCRKLDSIMNAFWWGHDIGARKLHMIGWDTLCLPKQEGGFGLKNSYSYEQSYAHNSVLEDRL